jgi:outer membrane protein OmpA-like peptidoglycan-associated protein
MVPLRRFFFLLCFSLPLFGQDADGCKDSPLVTRMPQSRIYDCERKEFEQFTVTTGVDKEGNAVEKTLEGEYFRIIYEGREGLSAIQVFRNYQNALRQAGFQTVYASSPGYQLARKGATWLAVDSNAGSEHTLHFVTVKAMEQEVTADASALKEEIEKSGRVSVYGIQFDTGKAVILQASEKVLDEVRKLLAENPDLKIRVEGHTDNTGAKAVNARLSLERAQAVAAWLAAHGIQAARMQAQGFGDSKPVADNSTEEGRARNRRVDLVKQ